MLDRDDNLVEVVRTWVEDEVLFAEIRYPGGEDLGRDPGGRIGGTVRFPTWEHRVEDGEVLRAGGSYYNPDDWVVEKGLRPLS